MVKKDKGLIRIDLDQFKLHVNIKDKIELSLHFDSPSRRFYLSLMAFVVNEMQKVGRITSIPLEEHHELLVLLNETVGGSAGSSKKKNLFPRIYRKWKGALSDLENAPLFKVLGLKKDYGDGIGRTYKFTEEQKDLWANLFEYKGSEENVRLRFSLDKLGASLNDIIITYGEGPDLEDTNAWDRFLDALEKNVKEDHAAAQILAKPESEVSKPKKWQISSQVWWQMIAVGAVIGLIVGGASFAVWNAYFRIPPAEVISKHGSTFPLPEKPSIAVLPFVNISGDPNQDYLSDGLSDQIITTLSKIEDLFVIARNSTFTYKGKPVKVQQVSEELGVRYVLEGSVHRTDDQTRITVQFIDAITGHHLWSEKYDRDLKNIFALQDEITKNILAALQVRLTEGEQALVFAKGTHSPEAYLKFSRGRELMLQDTKESIVMARQLFEEAITLDPHYAAAYCMLSYTYCVGAWLGWSEGESPEESLARAEELAQKAIALDDSLFYGHAVLSQVLALTGLYKQAITEGERAIALGPNYASAYAYFAYVLQLAGRYKEAIAISKKAIRLNPFPPVLYLHDLSLEYLFEGMYEDSIATCKKAIHRDPNNLLTHLILAANHSLLAREEEARDEIAEVIRIDPMFSLNNYENSLFLHYKNRADPQKFIEALRKVWPR